jgi:hypothetical protein
VKDVEVESEGLTDDQKKIVGYIVDPHAKLSAIRQFKGVKPAPAVKKGGKDGNPTLDEINELKAKGDSKWRELYKQYRNLAKIAPPGPFDF